LLPFIPCDQLYGAHNIAFYYENQQPRVKANSIRLLQETLIQTMTHAQQLTIFATLSLPAYTWNLVFKFFYKSQSFHYQFLPFFSPTTLRAQWVCLWRVVALLEGFINLCACLKNSQEDWKLGMPVGFLLDSEITNDDNKKLAKAYQFLGVPITGPYIPESLEGYTLADT
jgi:hypothetical protein